MNYVPFESLQKAAKSMRTGEPLSRRDVVIGGAEALAAFGTVYLLGSCASEYVPFPDAQKDYRLRQKYVDQAVRQNPPPAKLDAAVYRHDIVRYPNPSFPGSIMLMRTGFTIAPYSSVVERVELQVFRDAFGLDNEDEFLSTMVDHEYEHLRLFRLGTEIEAPLEVHSELRARIFTMDGDLREHFIELYAFSRQIKAFPERPDITGSFKDDMRYSYSSYRELVEKRGKTPLTLWLLERYPIDP